MRILVSGLSPYVKGGTENVVFNYIQYFRHKDIQIDILFYHQCTYMEEIQHLPISCVVVSFEELESVFQSQKYDYIWHHSSVNKVIRELKLAKKYGVPHRILHSHMSKQESTQYFAKLKSYIKKKLTSQWVSEYWSCSEVSKLLFLKPYQERAKILPNAIDIEKYSVDECQRQKLRQGFLEDEMIIGHIARMSEQKNQVFLLEVFEQLHKSLPKTRLVMIGAGPKKEEIYDLIKQKKLEESITIIGWDFNPAQYYAIFDLFLLPSLYEGLPLTVLEAQASGIYTLMSLESFDKHLNITGLVHTLPLSESLEGWAAKITDLLLSSTRKDERVIEAAFSAHQFIARENAKKLEGYFLTGLENPFVI